MIPLSRKERELWTSCGKLLGSDDFRFCYLLMISGFGTRLNVLTLDRNMDTCTHAVGHFMDLFFQLTQISFWTSWYCDPPRGSPAAFSYLAEAVTEWERKNMEKSCSAGNHKHLTNHPKVIDQLSTIRKHLHFRNPRMQIHQTTSNRLFINPLRHRWTINHPLGSSSSSAVLESCVK